MLNEVIQLQLNTFLVKNIKDYVMVNIAISVNSKRISRGVFICWMYDAQLSKTISFTQMSLDTTAKDRTLYQMDDLT